MLRKILQIGRNGHDGRIGYSFLADDEHGPMANAQIGDVVRVEAPGPPWIVVDETPTTAIVTRWPGRLYKVSIIEAARLADQPLAYARYTRVLSVNVLDEENPALLFGESGEEVVNILNKAMTLTRDLALTLSDARHPEAPAAYDRTFRRWANAEKLEIGDVGNLDGTLRIGSMPHGSPIYEGLIVLHTAIFERAKAIDGKAATIVDDEDEYLNNPWQGASVVFYDAALALGAPRFVSTEDRHILLNGWVHT